MYQPPLLVELQFEVVRLHKREHLRTSTRDVINAIRRPLRRLFAAYRLDESGKVHHHPVLARLQTRVVEVEGVVRSRLRRLTREQKVVRDALELDAHRRAARLLDLPLQPRALI